MQSRSLQQLGSGTQYLTLQPADTGTPMCTHSRVSVNPQTQPSLQRWLGLPWSIWTPDLPGVLSLSLETHTHGHPQLPGPFPMSSSVFISSHTLSHTPPHACACSGCCRAMSCSRDAGPTYLTFSHHLPKSYNHHQKHSNRTSKN